ncbi:MAG: FAD-dependent oxidoreductase [Candidatus Eremiobacteraeota bacterium]|nr:FAD-dependent oxidoreductase [Candidatus Eremiobacteraeota bacterium]
MKDEREADDVAIIGGGLAGTAIAIACARSDRPARVRLFSPENPGRGAAYGAGSPIWFMNAPASAMSIIADDAEHLVRSLHCAPESFITRERFGEYVGSTLRAATADRPNIGVERETIVNIERRRDDFVLEDDRGFQYRARSVVLAMGNAKPADDFLPRELRASERYVGDPWRAPTSELPNGDMLCIGSGLTAIDHVAAHAHAKRSGTVFTIARHGFLPALERADIPSLRYAQLELDDASPLALLRSVRSAMHRRLAQGGDWREIAEALRRPSQRIWLGWTIAQRRQFIAHLASLWGSLRYRVPPATADAVAELRASGRYVSLQGEIIGASDDRDGIVIEYRTRGEHRRLRVASVVNCTGPNGDLRSNPDRLIRALLERGLIRPDALHLGLDATPSGEAIDSEGLADERLLAIGPLLRGILYETTAVPEITEQARAIAQRVARDIELCVA